MTAFIAAQKFLSAKLFMQTSGAGEVSIEKARTHIVVIIIIIIIIIITERTKNIFC
jgi:hypothetical protein